MRALALQYTIALAIGAIGGQYFMSKLPTSVVTDLLKALSNIVAISSSILGFSISWMSHSKSIIKDIDYDAAEDLFEELTALQSSMLVRWGVALGSSFGAVIAAAFLSDKATSHTWPIPIATALLLPAILFVAILFGQMIKISKLKHRLDQHEREEVRRAKQLPGDKK